MKNLIYKWALGFVLRQHYLWRTTDGQAGTMLDVTGKNLSEARFNSANLSGAVFTQADLRGSSFADSYMNGSTFIKTKLQKSAFLEADLSFCDFSSAILRKVSWNMAGRIPQIEDLERLKLRARDLWRIVDSLNYKARMTDPEMAKELELDAADLEWFLKDFEIARKHHLGKG